MWRLQVQQFSSHQRQRSKRRKRGSAASSQ
jgi:hypothetical protein